MQFCHAGSGQQAVEWAREGAVAEGNAVVCVAVVAVVAAVVAMAAKVVAAAAAVVKEGLPCHDIRSLPAGAHAPPAALQGFWDEGGEKAVHLFTIGAGEKGPLSQ